MAAEFDAIVIGSGLGGLTAGALYARAGRRVLVLERNEGFGGAATTYRHGPLTIEASLHETSDPSDPRDPKARILRALGLRDRLDFVPVGALYEVRGGLFDLPFVMPHGMLSAEAALAERFPSHPEVFRRLFERIAAVREAVALVGEAHDTLWWFARAPQVPLKLWPLLRDMRQTLGEVFAEHFGHDEAPKLALAANLAYYGDDPSRLWWLYYAIAQGDLIASGGTYLRGGSRSLTGSLVDVIAQEGGAALAGRTVNAILLDDDGRAVGVRHVGAGGADPQQALAPVLFGNAAPQVLGAALPAMARERFLAPYAGRQLSISLFSAAFGLDRDPAELGLTRYSTMLLPDWMRRLDDFHGCGLLMAEPPGARMPPLAVVNYGAADSGLNPGGPHLVAAVGIDRLANWEGLSDATYAHRRDAWLDALVAALDRAAPGFAAALVHRELSTALTMRHQLNTPEGAIYGFAPEAPAGLGRRGGESGVRTAIDGLWLASAYGGFGGFTGAMLTGALAARAALQAAPHAR
ncbi:MAG: NAD(P)/FAD-dependent oxidoreductase [Alphaproteobacteria bacterium]